MTGFSEGFRLRSRLNTIKEKLVFAIWKPNFRQAQGPQQSGMTEAEDQRRQWNKASEADIPQAEAKQPYRKRRKRFGERTYRLAEKWTRK
jgi:hypothetical protein